MAIACWLGLVTAVTSLTAGCNAVRHAPGEAIYARDAVFDWVGDVVGAQPLEY